MSIRHSKISFFQSIILDFYHKAGRDGLPWRRKKISAYEVWVSEIMLQQTQVSRVIGYYEKFLKRFPTVQKLARASWEEFLPYYQGLGYYTRGRNMLLAAREVVAKYKGKFPRDKKLLMGLPGIGPYTASAILSFAYGDEHLAWDTNLKRVVGRFFLGSRDALKGHSRARLHRYAKHFGQEDGDPDTTNHMLLHTKTKRVNDKEGRVPLNSFSNTSSQWSLDSRLRGNDNRKFWGDSDKESNKKNYITIQEFFEQHFTTPKRELNAALMDFGSAICLARPKCGICPLQKYCRYYREKGKHERRIKNQPACRTGRESRIKQGKQINWQSAQVFLWLHEGHKRYYSSHSKRFEIFKIPATHNTRAGIKQYFQERYGLTLSVRPPHRKLILKNKPILLVNAQILLGEPTFRVFSKEVVREYNEKIKNW